MRYILCLAKGQNDSSEPYRLPQWITTNPAFQKPQKINSLQPGDGFIMANESKNVGWVIELNSELGLGIEIILEELIIGTENEDYLLIAGCELFEKINYFNCKNLAKYATK